MYSVITVQRISANLAVSYRHLKSLSKEKFGLFLSEIRSVEFSDGEMLLLEVINSEECKAETGKDNGNRKTTFEATKNIQRRKL